MKFNPKRIENVGIGRDDAPKGTLGSESGTRHQGQGGQSPSRRGRTNRGKRGTPRTQTTSRNAKRRHAPVIVREGTPTQMKESRANITVGSAETPEIGIRRNRATGKENLGPTRAKAKQTKGSLCVRKLGDRGQEGPSLKKAQAKQILTRLRRPKWSAEKFESGGSNPGATKKIAGVRKTEEEQAEMTSIFPRLTSDPRSRDPRTRAERMCRRAGAEPAQNPSSKNNEEMSMPPGKAYVAAWASAMTRWMAGAKRSGPNGSPYRAHLN